MTKTIIACCLSIILMASCINKSEPEYKLDDYTNILDLSNAPDSYRDDINLFSDMGAWHGFALLPNFEYSNTIGGFAGPALMFRNYTLGEKTMCVNLFVDNVELECEDAKVERTFYPGKLYQIFKWKDISLSQTLIFVNGRSSIVTTTVSNKGDNKNISLQFYGNYHKVHYVPIKEANGFVIKGVNNKMRFEINSSTKSIPNLIDSTYILSFDKTQINKGEEIKYVVATSAFFEDDDKEQYLKSTLKAMQEPDKTILENEQRWQQYAINVFNRQSPLFNDLSYKRLALKCVITLLTNWRSPAQDIHYNGGYPSYSGFSGGFWSWDSWKHSAAIASFDPFLAKEQIRVLFDYQFENGMIPDFVSRNKKYNNHRDTKPPLSTWAVEKIYDADKDLAFVEEMYSKLVSYHQWWYKDRDFDKDGLCEYGSTDGTLIAAMWESGMDNAVRFDDAKMLKSKNPLAWSVDQESVDLNAYLYDEKLGLERFARLLNKDDDAQRFKAESESLALKIKKLMFDEAEGYFFDVNIDSHKKVAVLGSEGWIPLWANAASKHQAEQVKNRMMDSSVFNSTVPLGTLDISHQKLDAAKGYWRGPVWLDQSYFGIKGLYNYGYKNEANELTVKLLSNAEGLMGNKPIYENYNPLTGEALNSPHFGWSAASVLMMMYEWQE